MQSYNSTECRDGVFGPSVWVEGCRGGFDFTLAFEESILSITPAAVFLLLTGPRLFYLLKLPDRTKRRAAYTSKLVASIIYTLLQVALLALVASKKKLNTNFSLAAAILNLIDAFAIVILAHFEHVKSIRPSFLLSAYLFVSLLFDAARLRTEWLLSVNVAYAAVYSASAALKLALLGLETIEKRKILIKANKTPSAESTSGPFSRGLFVWLNSLLISGWGTVLTNDGLPAIYEKLSSEKLAVRFGTAWSKATKKSKSPSIFLTTFSILRWEILGIMPPRLAIIALSLSQPFLISNALRFLSAPATDAAMNLGYGLIGAFALVFVGSALMTAWYEHLTFRAGAMVRGGLITLIYNKMMRLPTTYLNESSAVALMGNDVETLTEKLHVLLVESWANTLTVGIAMYMLADQLGAVCVAPIITAIVSISLSSLVGKMTVPRQTVYQKATQGRINFTSEVLGSLKAVKMLGLTERFRDLIAQKRDEELAVGIHYRWVSVYANCITNCNISLTEAITFGAYAIAAKLSGSESFSASQAITALSILTVMLEPLSHLVGNIPHSFSAFGCFKRIQEFLLLEERVDSRDIRGIVHETAPMKPTKEQERIVQEVIELQSLHRASSDAAHVSIVDGNFNWRDKNVLQGVTTSFPRRPNGSLTMIIGPIGSGKSSLLKAILGELASSNGVVSLNSPEVAFCDQTPWVMNATIRANIVAESRDYDSSWLNTVVNACDLSLDFSRLPEGDLTVVGDKGVKLSGGQRQRLAIARAVYSRKPVAIFDDVFSGLDKVTEQVVFSRVFGKEGLLSKNGTTVILATHAVHRLPESDSIIALDQNGRVVEQGSFAHLRSAGGYVESLDISSHFSDDEKDISLDTDSDTEVKGPLSSTSPSDQNQLPPSDMSVFLYYCKAIRPHNVAMQVAFTVFSGVIATFRYVWITWWGNGRGHDSTDLGYWLTTYSVLSLLEGILITMAIALFLLVVGPTSGRTLHRRMLDAVMNAPMKFVSNTDAGSLVNRFSQDLRYVDMVLPVALSVFIFEITACLGAAGLAIAAVSWFAISIPFVIAILVLIQRFYVRTSKQLRLLEIEHKAPLFSHFLESIHGLATIRAFGWVQPYADKNLTRLDDAQKPAYLLNCIQRWLTLVLDLVVAFLTIILVVFAVTLREKVNPSLLGVALVNMMRLGANMKGIILYWSILETSLGAITRIRTFSEKTPSERDTREGGQLSEDWPASGAVEVNDLSVQYDQTADPILRGLTFSIKHGEKFGLCGRSGSGKSSFVQALLRMADIVGGRITLDGEDLTNVPRATIRQKLSCLTQDPCLFSDTIRFNADPQGISSDETITKALERVGIWSAIKDKVGDDQNPLDEKIDENFLSHGQRQLFCLARALLKKSTLLVLDEPTSSVDSHTDAKIQEVIRSEFSDCTIIMIAHRLDTLLDFDKIAVLDRGSLVEFGAPQDLLANEDGAFRRLYYADQNKKVSK
ncbi:P-loop containing nucleoside triphosphate hydrolase protein [Dactylonectria estremocensis]|uniref:P-loop containing nucleoside triphosphate hydrolase protein n=1 Tax=Dactylonectria estremocensis TaxID=1079267 RepID=A0A9P9F3G9_9HYPO|nr:P-loop containing nucleoside triphosphate hydrolase protein [Dactylonectria estremocensis]